MAALDLDVALALRHFDLTLALRVEQRETLALVGPSGAGKTSLLRTVAGAARPHAGRITLGGRTLFDASRRVSLPPEARRVGYVFQEHALFPHMTVRTNVAFAGRGRVDELLERFGIAHLADARPRQLSGGESQRVGLVRALASDPEILLFDEPLSALDAHTRAGVRDELRAMLRELELPALLVTHDFEDAAALADRVGVIVAGGLRQLGTPADLMAEPADAFVASFVGSNLLPGVASRRGSGLSEVALEGGGVIRAAAGPDGPVGVLVHPWHVTISPTAAGDDPAVNRITAPISTVVPSGNRLRVRVGRLVVEIPPEQAAEWSLGPGSVVTAEFRPADTRLLPRDRGDGAA